MPVRGIYFLANDAIIDLVIAFLNSFRTFNPTLKLCLIPYNDIIDRLSQLREKYRFDIYSDTAMLRRCDIVSQRFHGRIIGQYRKLVAWDGAFDEFVYVDSDTVILENMNFVFDLLTSFDFITAVSNVPSIRMWVWKNSVYDAGVLSPEQIGWAANTGFIASKKAMLGIAEAERKLPAAVELARHMELTCTEQPFLNYLIVTSGRPHSSLHAIRVNRGGLDPPGEHWGGRWLGIVLGGRIIYPKKSRPLFVHWAGSWRPSWLERRFFALVRKLGLARRPLGVRLFMRNGRLWRYYWNMRRILPGIRLTD